MIEGPLLRFIGDPWAEEEALRAGLPGGGVCAATLLVPPLVLSELISIVGQERLFLQKRVKDGRFRCR